MLSKNLKDNMYKYKDLEGKIKLGFKDNFNQELGFDGDNVLDELFVMRDKASS